MVDSVATRGGGTREACLRGTIHGPAASQVPGVVRRKRAARFEPLLRLTARAYTWQVPTPNKGGHLARRAASTHAARLGLYRSWVRSLSAIDIAQAYLQAELVEDLYMMVPPLMPAFDVDGDRLVCKLTLDSG